MVTVATALDELYPVDTKMAVELKGFISGNYGSYNRHWAKAADGDELAGHGFLYATGASGEDTINLWAQNEENGQGIVGWDPTMQLLISTVPTAGEPIPYFLFAENPGMIFQGQVADTNGNWNAGAPIDAGAAGVFETGDYANKIYTFSVYYIADTAAASQLLVMRVATGGHGG